MKKKLLAALFGATLVLGACGGDKAEEKPADNDAGGEVAAADGEAIVNQSCIACHGGDLTGGSGPAIDKIGGTLSEDEILDVIENGKGGMPGGVVKGDDAKAAAAWLATQK